MIDIRPGKDGARFPVAVVPRSSRDEIAGELDGALKVRITAPPVDGKANKHLVRVLSKALGVAKTRLAIVDGETSRRKVLCLTGADESELRRLLDAVL